MNRIDFLKKLLLGAGAIVIAPSVLFGKEPKHLPIKTKEGKKGYVDFKLTDKIIIPAELQTFAHEFSLGFKTLSAGDIPHTYCKGNYRIDYYRYMHNDRGNPLKTSSRISSTTGIIEISKCMLSEINATENFVFYLIIWNYIKKETTIKHNIQDDTYADIATMRYYLHTNRPTQDIMQGWYSQFGISPSNRNNTRYRFFCDYIKTCRHTFDKQKFNL